MKRLLTLLLPLFVVGCASILPPPQPGTAAHQQMLAEQARQNFLALKAEERKNNPQLAARAPSAPVRMKPFQESQPQPTYVGRRPKKERSGWPFAKREPRRPADDTVYYWDVPRTNPTGSSRRVQAAEARYARELAKPPEDLSDEERLWARRHYY